MKKVKAQRLEGTANADKKLLPVSFSNSATSNDEIPDLRYTSSGMTLVAQACAVRQTKLRKASVLQANSMC